jgi:hypothetical protein
MVVGIERPTLVDDMALRCTEKIRKGDDPGAGSNRHVRENLSAQRLAGLRIV